MAEPEKFPAVKTAIAIPSDPNPNSPKDEACNRKKCRCSMAKRILERMNYIAGEKGDGLGMVEVRSARVHSQNLIDAHAKQRAPLFPQWWWEIVKLREAVRDWMEPVRKLEGGWHAGCAGPHDPDAGSYRTIAVRALEDCR